MALDKWEKKHMANIAKYEKEIQQIYATAIAEASQMASRVNFDPSKPFVFSDYPLTKALIAKLQKQVASDIEAVITKGVDTEFGLSQEKAEELAQSVYSDVESALMELRKQAYISQRNKAREAFLTRKEAGLSLSDRVWRYTGQFKEELEMALDLGLRDGLSADELSREVRKYLNNPNMLFRRVRDEHGVLHLSKRAKAYHPGQGVYRSSYKNARRLTATETNMAYRTADYNAYQALDFVVGIRIMLSNNHTLNGEPFFDICDNLSAPNGSTATKGKGCYPKDFKFTGWHPLCRCFVQTIHKTKEELREDTRRMREGLPPLPPEQSANYVGDVPDEFKAWCRLNAGRVERAKSLPYFIKDNRGYYDSAFATQSLTPLQVAEQRHAQRTPEQAQAIRNRWHERQEYIGNFSAEQLAHFKKLEADLGIKRGMPMSVDDADKQAANPNFEREYILDVNGRFTDGVRRYSKNPQYDTTKHKPYAINCQTCASAYMLRLQGFDVTAKPCTSGSTLDYLSKGKSFDVWLNADGTPAKHNSFNDWMSAKGYKQMSKNRYLEFFDEQCKEVGVYELVIGWKRGGGHATILQRFADGTLRYIEPQADNSIGSGYEWDNLEHLADRGARSHIHDCRGIMRIDDKLFNLLFTGIFSR